MKKVIRYPLEMTDKQILDIPEGSQILHVGDQVEVICLWVKIDDEKPIQHYSVFMTKDKEELPNYVEEMEYIGTAIQKFLVQNTVCDSKGVLPKPRVKTYVWHCWGAWKGN